MRITHAKDVTDVAKSRVGFCVVLSNSGIYEPMRGSVMVWDTL